jgi:hypothetical protein
MRPLAGERIHLSAPSLSLLSAGPLFWLLDMARFGTVERWWTTVAGALPGVWAGQIRWCLGAAGTPWRDCKRVLRWVQAAMAPTSGGSRRAPSQRPKWQIWKWIQCRWQGKSCHPFFRVRVRVCDSSPLLLNATVELRSIGAALAHGSRCP